MTQGRKSKTARVLGCLLAALLALAAFAPALAAAQAVDDEYELAPNIPNTPGTDQQANGGGGAPGTDLGASQGGQSSAGGGQGAGSANSAATQVPALNAESSDDGGAPVLLILLAIVAAGCTAVAVWRLRRHPEHTERDTAQGAKPTTSAASETQSL